MALGACSHVIPMRLQMEVGYPLVAQPSQRVWAALAVSKEAVSGFQPDDRVVVVLDCDNESCSVQRVLPAGTHARLGAIEGRYARDDERTNEALIVLEGFPATVDAEFAERLKFEAGKRKFIRVTYAAEELDPNLPSIEMIEAREGPPLIWK